jgi:quercetin dioxygenase-like cupin family protein
MENLDRRSAIVLGAAIFVPLVSLSRPAAAAMYAPDAGKEIMPGIRQVELGEWPIGLTTYKKAVVNDYIAAPGAAFPEEKMKNDMICHIIEGEFWVKQGDKEFIGKTGHVFTCSKDSLEEDKNPGTTTAVMRVIDLLSA